ncbi:MAG: 2-hydroxyglutaryl-CoA dehydratase [Dehalococcoidales bacterium]|nr:2-hydroxyglutaryl-CoA dehydratase [Dehalococcoidales bacterium]
MIAAGVDIGSSASKAVILENNKIISMSIIPTGIDSAETARRVMEKALGSDGMLMKDIQCIVSTGYGRVNVPFARKNITEISCHARGINYYFPSVRTVLDMGGQDCKIIHCDGQGNILKFALNDKCAAGTGRYLERISSALSIPLQDIGPLSLQTIEGGVPISSYCAIFAQDDVITLIRQGKNINDILAGVCDALVERILSLVLKLGMVEDFSVCGGIAKNSGVVSRLEDRLGAKALIAPEPQIAGALGAAIFAREMAERS